jgi:GNAT superfamily N-acetyltransferase
VIIGLASTDGDVQQILNLQQKNLPSSLDVLEMQEQGFVTVQHDPEVLYEMNLVAPAVVAKYCGAVVGYALVMPIDFKDRIPILLPMFRMIDDLTYHGRSLSSYDYFVMGQVCISKEFRGIGLFDQLYTGLKLHLSNKYDLLITEVATRNTRSLKAHLRVGLKTIHVYADDRGEQWELMVWDWNHSCK